MRTAAQFRVNRALHYIFLVLFHLLRELLTSGAGGSLPRAIRVRECATVYLPANQMLQIIQCAHTIRPLVPRLSFLVQTQTKISIQDKPLTSTDSQHALSQHRPCPCPCRHQRRSHAQSPQQPACQHRSDERLPLRCESPSNNAFAQRNSVH